MQPATVGAILESIARHWTIAPDLEVTLEANPTSVEAERFRGYRSAGVNRVSLGVQSLDDRVLAELGRTHTAREALDAVGIARSVFERYSFDLIYARPRQTPQEWAGELRLALAQAGEHLSLYQLTIEPDTPFAALHAAGKLKTPNDDTARTLYDATLEICAAHGLPAYEISNHARPGGECRHNLIYWRASEYAGIGPAPMADSTSTEPGAPPRPKKARKPGSPASRRRGTVSSPTMRSRARKRPTSSCSWACASPKGSTSPALPRSPAGRLIRAGSRRCCEHGLVETTSDGRLRVTLPGFPVLDAVVADLAA